MKKKWLFIGAAVLCAALILFFSGFFYARIPFRNVKEVRLSAYDHVHSGETGLTKEESRKLVMLYNLSRHAGEVTGEPCCDAFGFTVNFTDGSTLYVGEGTKSKVIVRPGYGEPYYLENQKLIDYIHELVKKICSPHGLIRR